MKSLIALSCVCLAAVVVQAARAEEAAAKQPLTVEDLWAMHRVGSPVVSPDGQQVVLKVTVYSHEDNKGEGDLWVVPVDGSAAPRRLTWQKGAEGDVAWSPDGKHLAFVSKRGEDDAKQLYLLPMAGGEAEPVTELPMSVSSPKWFPDGKRIAFVASTFPDLNDNFEQVGERLKAQKDDKTEAKISDNRVLRYWDHYLTDGTIEHVFAVDLESREVKDLMPGYNALLGFGGLEWDLSPDGKEIAFAANHTDPPWQKLNSDIFLLTLENGEIRCITEDNPAYDGDPSYSPDGRYLLYGRNRRPEISPDFTRLARYDRTSGAMVELTAEWDFEPTGWVVTDDGSTIFFHAQSKGRRSLFRMSIDGGTPELVVEGGATGSVRTAGANRIVYLEETFHRPDDLYRLDLAGSGPTTDSPKKLTSFNDERLAAIDFGAVEDVTFEGAGGNPVQMHVLLPPGFDPAKKWPLLVLVHGGPHGAWLDSFHFRWNAALFAAPGYVVAAVNFHGSTGFGQAFAESILGNHADKPFTDVMKATDFMLERGYIDPERLAAAGGSYGGYMMSWILGHTDRFACLVNHAGVYDLMAQFASDYTWGRSNNYGASPWQDPERIDRYSPSRYAKNFATPTLILHGELDYRVPVTQGINLHGVLTGKGVASRIVIFPKENHWIRKPQAAKLWWNEVHGWLKKHLAVGAE